MSDTPNGETGTKVEPKNDVSNPVTPTATPEEKKPDEDVTALKERLRVAEQKAARVGQVENKLAEIEKAQQEAEAKELMEQNKFKDLSEKQAERIKQLEEESERKERDAQIKSKTDEIYKDYPDAVREIADEAELKLADTDEDSVEAFKKKLDNFKARIGNAKVTPNNPGTPTPKEDFNPAQYKDLAKNPAKLEEHWKKHSPLMAQMIKPAE